MMQKAAAVIVTCMMTAPIGTRVAVPLTAAVLVVPVVRQAQRVAVHLRVQRTVGILQVARKLIRQVHPLIVRQRRKAVLRFV